MSAVKKYFNQKLAICSKIEKKNFFSKNQELQNFNRNRSD